MDTFALVVVITLIAGVGGTGIGGIIGVLFNKNSEKIVSLLLSFAGGVMVAVVCFDLLNDALGQDPSVGHVFIVLGSVLLGYAVVYLLNYVIDRRTNPQVKHIDEAHPKTADQLSELIHSDHYEEHRKEYDSEKTKKKTELFIAGLVMAFAIALHNLPEGMVIGASYASEKATSLSLSGGLAVAIVIGLHNIPEGMSVSVPLVAGGMHKATAAVITAITGIPTVFGAMLGYWLGALSPLSLTISLSFASGAMLYVVYGELLPESILMWRSKAPAFAQLIGLMVGVLILFI